MKFIVGQTVRVKSITKPNTRSALYFTDVPLNNCIKMADKFGRSIRIGDTFKIYDTLEPHFVRSKHSYRSEQHSTWCNEEDLELISTVILSNLRKNK